ncbi:CRAL/TRIO domain-containing protein [Obba rivulosa]|uniref:Phosphatidylinositol transfer protein SFH5 n=1 Tax=Obba rivulosa TaxID=1052685 RepID=A0A8E2AR44_9APHY|nr:CRAL/TRIO domain-containing protein [Obba rivulosa]
MSEPAQLAEPAVAAVVPAAPPPAPAPQSEPRTSHLPPPAAHAQPLSAAFQNTVSVVQDAEPQNALTQKFTEPEWAALRELRAQLPDVFADAFPDRPKPVAPVTIWGVTIDAASPRDARVSVVLMKFLRARDLDVPAARTMLTETLRWRDAFKIDEVVKASYDEKTFGNIGKIFGHDKEGRPVVYNLYGENKHAFDDVDVFIRWRIAFMEKSIGELDFETRDQTLQIHDYGGVSVLFGRNANQKAAAAQATQIFRDYYPEFLSNKFFVNMPSVLSWVFWIFKSILPAKTLAKMNMVGSGRSTIAAALLPYIDASQLPKRYGGDAPDFA